MAAPMKSGCLHGYKHAIKYHHKSQTLFNQISRSATGLKSSRNDDFSDNEIKKDSEGFRYYQLKKNVAKTKRKRNEPIVRKPPQPRSAQMPVNQDWTNVWPTAQTFNWSVVPLPIRQGVLKSKQEAKGDGLPPGKYANTELIKIPNFLHLTPKHIEKHCNAIKKFCTEWPAEIQNNKAIDYHFPLEVITEDYCISSPSVRDPRARVVTFKFKTSDLEMDDHAREKWQRLVKSRENKVTLTSDRCPMRQQNYDYLQYLLTALYFESWKVEPWESEITPEDLLEYSWDYSQSKKNVVSLLNIYREKDQTIDDPSKRQLPYVSETVNADTVASLEPVNEYKKSLEELYSTGENITTLNNYKESVLKMLNVKKSPAVS